jgi:hypothetical protein
MNGYQTRRHVDQMVHDLDLKRADLEGTLHSIEQKFSTHYFADRLQKYVEEGVVADYVRNLSSSIAANPLPTTLMGVSLAWLMLAGNSRAHAHEGPSIREKASSATHEMGARMKHARERTQDTYNWMVQEHPLALGMIGVAAGAALGAALPESRAEDEAFGPARDTIMRKAERAMQAATAAAQEEAERQGMPSEIVEPEQLH